MHLPSRRRMIAALAAVVALAALPGVARAGDPVPGVDVNLGQNPPITVVRGTTDRAGGFTFNNLAPGNYEIFLDSGKITKPVVIVIERSGLEPVTSAPINPTPNSTRAFFKLVNVQTNYNLVVSAPTRDVPIAPVTVRVQTYDPPAGPRR